MKFLLILLWIFVPLAAAGITFAIIIGRAYLKAKRKNIKLREESEILIARLQEYQQEARIDFLTQIPTRKSIMEFLEREWNRLLEDQKAPKEEVEALTVMMLDIDNFKLYNDEYGHLQGDECLRAVSLALSESLRPTDSIGIGRFGGEEFIVAIVGLTAEKAEEVAERLRIRIAKKAIKHKDSNEISFVTVSIGVAIGIPGIEFASVDDMIDSADKALYKAKDYGKNQVEMF